MRIGVDYYPEHWDKSMWVQDADNMKAAGVHVVRMAEFAWSRLEPVEGVYDFEWLDEMIGLFRDRGIEVVLCTPTSTPPQWLFEKHPETIQVGKDGRRIQIGIRGHRCMTSPVFRRLSEKMIREMVTHYKDDATVVGYQIDNELEANHCRCDVCALGFRAWIQKRYGTVEAVNQAYGNNVWSGEYSDFSQVKPPMGDNIMWQHPSLTLDYNRYASDSTVDYVEFQRKLIHEIDPKVWITTNNWLCENMPDFYKMFEKLDFVSYDNYPTTQIPEDRQELYSHNFHLDLMRGIKRQNFWIMEQLSGPVGSWMPMSSTLKPSMLEGYSLQAYAHGADTVVHFRWRTAVSGAEMYWHGILDHNNLQGRRYQEFCRLGQRAKELEALQGTTIQNRVAILYGSDQEYCFKLQHQADGMYYMEQMKLLHQGFSSIGIGVDIIDEHAELSQYDVVIAPTLSITHQDVVDHIHQFAAQGGILVMTNRSGVKDESNKCIIDALPTVYRDLTGAWVSEYDVIGNRRVNLTVESGSWDVPVAGAASGTQWCDLLVPEEAETLLSYGEGFYRGTAAVTRNHYQGGEVYYLGTVLNAPVYTALAKQIAIRSRMWFVNNLPTGVEYTTRTDGEKVYGFLFNNTDQSMCFVPQIEGDLQDNLQGGLQDGTEQRLEPFEMKICTVDNKDKR